MTLMMAVHIIFSAIRGRNAIELRRVSEVQIERTWKEFTGRAEIKMPRNIKILNGLSYTDIFKNGDPVEIRIGYGVDEPPVEFTGYISDVSEGVPVVIRCEDEMYRLKRGNVSVVSSAITLRNLLQQAAPGYEIDCPDMNLGAVRFLNVAPITILDQIKKDTDGTLYSYFDGKVLRCGVIYSDQSNVPVVGIHLEKNAVSESLNKKNSVENLLVELTSVLAKGKKNTARAGKEGGDVIKKNYNFPVSLDDLKKEAEKLLKQAQVQGFDGSITLFGIPAVHHGMKVHIKSDIFKNMEGTFYIEKVVKKFGDSGFRQEVTLGDKAI